MAPNLDGLTILTADESAAFLNDPANRAAISGRAGNPRIGHGTTYRPILTDAFNTTGNGGPRPITLPGVTIGLLTNRDDDTEITAHRKTLATLKKDGYTDVTHLFAPDSPYRTPVTLTRGHIGQRTNRRTSPYSNESTSGQFIGYIAVNPDVADMTYDYGLVLRDAWDNTIANTPTGIGVQLCDGRIVYGFWGNQDLDHTLPALLNELGLATSDHTLAEADHNLTVAAIALSAALDTFYTAAVKTHQAIAQADHAWATANQKPASLNVADALDRPRGTHTNPEHALGDQLIATMAEHTDLDRGYIRDLVNTLFS